MADRRSTTSLLRDYGVPMQDPNAFSLQYGKDTTRDPRKGLLRKKSTKKPTYDLKDKTGLLKIHEAVPMKQAGGKLNEISLESIYSKYPAFRNMGEVTLHPDTAFTKDKTGVGDIEYFSPEEGREKVTYGNGSNAI